jgi:UDP-N-acetylmuramoyl-tripeptide--D-alanyl-D-alanine ligase
MREKGAVYRALPEGGVAVVNADDPLVIRAADEAAVRARVTFGAGAGADYRLVARSPLGAAGARVTLTRGPGGEPIAVTLPIPGEAAAIDLAAALAAQEAVSGEALSPVRIDAALAGLRLEGRATARRLGGDTLLLDDTYNANPGSVRAALATLRELGAGRRLVAVLGEMKELGEHARREHEALGDPIADAGVALAIGCGGIVDLTLARAGARGVEVVFAEDTAGAAREAALRVRPGDAVLVKGSRSVGADHVVAALVRDLGETPEVLPTAPNSASSPGS